MITNQINFLDFISQRGIQFVIPVYQRTYAWASYQCEDLWGDIKNAGTLGTSHFMSMTLFSDAGYTQSGLHRLDIIDGQQRTATAIILLAAFSEYLRKNNIQVEDASLGKIDSQVIYENYLCTGPEATAPCKIRLLNIDHTTLDAVVHGRELPAKTSKRVMENYNLFLKHMDEEEFDPQVFWNGVRHLIIISVELDKEDKAQVIFEGLNTKGTPLTAADLMRNYLLVAKSRTEQKRLYWEYWNPIELMFEDDILSSASLKLNVGLRMWLAIRFRQTKALKKNRIYSYFKAYMNTTYTGTTEELLEELRAFCYVWAENYKCNEGRSHCSSYTWAKDMKPVTLVPTSHSLSNKKGSSFTPTHLGGKNSTLLH